MAISHDLEDWSAGARHGVGSPTRPGVVRPRRPDRSRRRGTARSMRRTLDRCTVSVQGGGLAGRSTAARLAWRAGRLIRPARTVAVRASGRATPGRAASRCLARLPFRQDPRGPRPAARDPSAGGRWHPDLGADLERGPRVLGVPLVDRAQAVPEVVRDAEQVVAGADPVDPAARPVRTLLEQRVPRARRLLRRLGRRLRGRLRRRRGGRRRRRRRGRRGRRRWRRRRATGTA